MVGVLRVARGCTLRLPVILCQSLSVTAADYKGVITTTCCWLRVQTQTESHAQGQKAPLTFSTNRLKMYFLIPVALFWLFV